MGTVAAHKSCEFQEYRLRELPLRGEKVAKISNFGVFSDRKSPNIGDWGQIWQVAADHALPSLTPIGSVVRPCRAKS